MSSLDFSSKYPLIYKNCIPRIGPGWSGLLDVLSAQLQARADAGGSQAQALHAREKWGRLSLRFRSLDPADEAVVAYVESLSTQICEVCGLPGRLIQEPWLRTRCKAHVDERPSWPTSAR